MKINKLIKCLTLGGIIFTASACGGTKTIAVTGIDIDQESAVIEVNGFDYLNATISPSDATNKKITWSSSNESLASVDNDGFVVAKGLGEVTITATSVDGNFKDTCKITIKKELIHVDYVDSYEDKVVLTYSSITPDKYELSPIVLPLDADDQTLTFTSANTDIATVNSKGVITGGSAIGETTITIASVDNPEATKAVRVENCKSLSATNAKKVASAIKNKQTELGLTVDKARIVEDYYVQFSKNNTPQSTSYFIQESYIANNKEDVYFSIFSDDTDIHVEDGTPSTSRSGWIMYTTKKYMTYLFHEVGTETKNYLQVDTTSYIGNPLGRWGALCEVLDNLFTSGSAIVIDQLDGVLNVQGLSWLGSQTPLGPKSTASDPLNDPTHLISAFAAYYTGQVATIDDEQDLNIPYGTKYDLEIARQYEFRDYYCEEEIIDQNIYYSLDGDSFIRDYDIRYTYYHKDIEIFYPDFKDYSEVESIFDL